MKLRIVTVDCPGVFTKAAYPHLKDEYVSVCSYRAARETVEHLQLRQAVRVCGLGVLTAGLGVWSTPHPYETIECIPNGVRVQERHFRDGFRRHQLVTIEEDNAV